MTIPLPQQGPEPLVPRSTLLLHWDPSRPRQDIAAEALATICVTGQVGAFTRDTTASATDASGQTYTVPPGVPAWDYAAGGPALLTGGDDAVGSDEQPEHLAWPINFPPQAMTVLLVFRQAADALTTDTAILNIGLTSSGVGPGWRVVVQSDGDYVVERIASSSAIQTQTHSGVGAAGKRRYVLITVADDGKLSSAIYDEDAELLSSEGPSSASALPSAFEDDAVQVGPFIVGDRHGIEALKIAAGVLTFDEIRAAF